MPPDFYEWDKAKCLAMLQENPKNALAAYRLAVIAFDENKIEEAKLNLLKVHEIDQDFLAEKVNTGLGEIFEMNKEYEKALPHYKLLYKVTNEKQKVLLKIAKCFQKTKQYENAVKAYDQAIAINTKNAESY